MKTKARLLIVTGVALTLGTTLYVGVGLADTGSDCHHGHHKGRHHGGWHGHGQKLFEQFDTNQDGKVTQAEVNQVRAEHFARFDADKDGKLSPEEYEALWLDAMRARMTERFQKLDDDGDSAISAEEFGKSKKLFSRLDRNEDGEITRDEIASRHHHKWSKDDKEDDK